MARRHPGVGVSRTRFRGRQAPSSPPEHLPMARRPPDAAAQRLLRDQGDAVRVFALARAEWPGSARSQLLRIPGRARVLSLRPRRLRDLCLRPRRPGKQPEARATARADARALRRHPPTLRGRLGRCRSRPCSLPPPRPRHHAPPYRDRHPDQHHIAMYTAAARRRLGELLGGTEGAELLQQGDAAMRAQGVKEVDAMTELFVPGGVLVVFVAVRSPASSPRSSITSARALGMTPRGLPAIRGGRESKSRSGPAAIACYSREVSVVTDDWSPETLPPWAARSCKDCLRPASASASPQF